MKEYIWIKSVESVNYRELNIKDMYIIYNNNIYIHYVYIIYHIHMYILYIYNLYDIHNIYICRDIIDILYSIGTSIY